MAGFAPDAPRIETLFTDEQGQFRFARWSRPIVPVIFGAADESLPPLKGAIETVVMAAGHKMSDNDADLGANLMIFFLKDWHELAEVQNMDQLVPNLPDLLPRLQREDADQYRFFRFDADNSIKAGFVFLRMRGALVKMSAADLGLEQMLKAMLLWAPDAFAESSALVRDGETGQGLLRPDLAAILNAAYDPVLPGFSDDASLALRLAARAQRFYN
ncbi:hypothetical protein [Pseudooceanicola algae]|uniref:Uncharacterized protein n=1 Tax=Pseudooceanicola algae TaxID=1537215 RepID=A0A418SGM5_9RHOB|nr:hypothetical protein [Pseudooceanicola algae]QPM88926.1 hypothetical protein PSAL_001290 [Pseudooceanicola algae]